MRRNLNTLLIFFLLLQGMNALAQDPVVITRFANPELNTATQTYTLDVEFQCNTPGKQLLNMNVLFYYDDSILEFVSFGEYAQGYGPMPPDPPNIWPYPQSYASYWGFSGPPEYVNGAIQKATTSSVYLSTTDWTKLFNVTFHVDDPNAMNGDFCPSVVWDLKEDGSGGFMAGDGVTITLAPALFVTENVVPFNWAYDGIPGIPYGYPVDINCVSARVAPTTKIQSTLANANGSVTFPFLVYDFTDISSFSLTVDYDPLVLEYCCAVPNDAIAINFDTTLIYPGRIQMTSTGFDTSLVDETVLIYLTFLYQGGSSSIMWCDDGSSCQYIDLNTGLPLPDEPTTNFYFDGNVSPGQFVWTGTSSSDWSDAANWQNNLVPTGFDAATVNSSPLPPHYPTFTGDFLLGGHCKDLTLNGEAEFSVTGDLTINPGSTLTMTDSGEVIVGGDWTNSGTFNPGFGQVTFSGSGNGTIGSGSPPSNFVSGYIYSSFAQGMTWLTAGNAGPTGDNAHSDVSIGFPFSYLGVDYTQLRINTNGWISFNLSGDDPVSHENCRLFSTSGPTTVIAPWWDDLLADGSSSITYKTEGVSPNRVFTVEWKNVLAFSSGSSARLNFQVKLYETSNTIELCYGTAPTGTHSTGEGASIGIKDATGGPGNFMEAIYGTTNTMVGCLVSDTDWPTMNYRFSLPVQSDAQTFHHLNVSKDSGELRITQNVIVTGID